MKLIEFESKEQRYKTIEGIYHSLDKPKVYRIRKKCKELGFKPPHKKTVKRILAELETESVKEPTTEPVVEPTVKDKPTIEVKRKFNNKPCCTDNEEIPKDYVVADGSYSCPNCYKSFNGSQIVRSEGAVFTVTKYKELHLECPYCHFLLGTLSEFKAVWDKKHSKK